MRLIERESQLAGLRRLVDDARAGRGVLALVCGEGGAGKTALVSAFLAEVATRVAVGACDALTMPAPLGPVIEIATQLEVDAALPRDELFGTVLDTLRQQPTVLLIEDLHWADDATGDFVLYLARRIDRVPVVLVLTYRDDEIGSNAPLTRLVGELARHSVASRVSVPSLSEAGVAAMVAGSGLDAREVFRQTAGNAFFVCEIVAAGSTTSATVREAVLARVCRLSPMGRHVLDLASQVGVRFDADLLIEASAADADGVDECIRVGLIRSVVNNIEFRHELSRATVAAEIPPIRRAAMNGAILRALERRNGVDVARLANHAAAAHEADAAFRYGIEAGQRAADLGAHRQALHHYRAALQFASQRADNERAALLDQVAAECMVTDQMTDAIAASEEALRLWQAIGDPIRKASAHMSLDYICWYLGQGDRARSHADAAVAILEPHGPSVELAQALAGSAALDVEVGIHQRAAVTSRRALDMAVSMRNQRAECDALNTLGCALAWSDELEEGIKHLERSLQIGLQCGFGHLAGRAYANLASTLAENNAFERSDAVIAEGLRYTDDHDLAVRHLCLTGVLAESEMNRGRWDDATADALGMLERTGTMNIGRIPALTVLGTIQMRRGEATGHATLLEARRLAEETNEPHRIAPVALALAEQAWLSGDTTTAGTIVASTLARSEPTADPRDIGRLLSWAVRLGGRQRAPDAVSAELALEIEQCWDEAATIWSRLERPYEQALALLEVGTSQALTMAFNILDSLRARPAAHRAAASLRDLGVRVPRGVRDTTRANPAGLTTREFEVLRLVADGMTNAEIANNLFISSKTTEHHVSRILAKLGVRTRREATRAAREIQTPSP